ncbi:unnamed protein product [Urochloa humidicola]
MAGAGNDGQRLWDLSRRAASFLRMARLALTGGAAAPAQLIAEGEAIDGHIVCNPYYKSVRTEDDDLDSDGPWAAEEDESELLVNDEDGGSRSTARGVSENSGNLVCGVGPLNNNKSSRSIRLRPATTAAAESSEPLMERRRPAKLVNDAEMVRHPFGCDRRESESSSLLLVSS